ncbi:MAG: antibiotic biosynthesis monooxygenase [Nocardioidaceae bacterium]
MSVVKINAITVPADSGDELARRFAGRAGQVQDQDGFEGFELLRPTDGRSVWLVVTRWRDEDAFAAWTAGQDFQRAHARREGEAQDGEEPRRPVGISAELWSYDVAGGR